MHSDLISDCYVFALTKEKLFVWEEMSLVRCLLRQGARSMTNCPSNQRRRMDSLCRLRDGDLITGQGLSGWPAVLKTELCNQHKIWDCGFYFGFYATQQSPNLEEKMGSHLTNRVPVQSHKYFLGQRSQKWLCDFTGTTFLCGVRSLLVTQKVAPENFSSRPRTDGSSMISTSPCIPVPLEPPAVTTKIAWDFSSSPSWYEFPVFRLPTMSRSVWSWKDAGSGTQADPRRVVPK